MLLRRIKSFHSIHNAVDRGVLQVMWEKFAGKVGHRDQLIICQPRLSENALFARAACARGRGLWPPVAKVCVQLPKVQTSLRVPRTHCLNELPKYWSVSECVRVCVFSFFRNDADEQ